MKSYFQRYRRCSLWLILNKNELRNVAVSGKEEEYSYLKAWVRKKLSQGIFSALIKPILSANMQVELIPGGPILGKYS